jgi:acyl carrier protein
MSEMELHDQLKALVAEIIEIEEFGDDEDFVTQLGVDSMLALEIVARIEKRYRIRVPEESFAQMQTLRAVVQVVTAILQPVSTAQ